MKNGRKIIDAAWAKTDDENSRFHLRQPLFKLVLAPIDYSEIPESLNFIQHRNRAPHFFVNLCKTSKNGPLDNLHSGFTAHRILRFSSLSYPDQNQMGVGFLPGYQFIDRRFYFVFVYAIRPIGWANAADAFNIRTRIVGLFAENPDHVCVVWRGHLPFVSRWR